MNKLTIEEGVEIAKEMGLTQEEVHRKADDKELLVFAEMGAFLEFVGNTPELATDALAILLAADADDDYIRYEGNIEYLMDSMGAIVISNDRVVFDTERNFPAIYVH